MGTLANIERSASGINFDFTIHNDVIGAAVSGIVLTVLFVLIRVVIGALMENFTANGKKPNAWKLFKQAIWWVVATTIFYEIFGANWLSRLIEWFQTL